MYQMPRRSSRHLQEVPTCGRPVLLACRRQQGAYMTDYHLNLTWLLVPLALMPLRLPASNRITTILRPVIPIA